MRRLTASLVTAAAVTGALALIPLALACPALAATTPPPGTYNSTNWAGYVDVPTTGNVVGLAYATFTVPKINCAKSLIGPHEASLSYRKAHGNDWSAVAYWVGIDGQGGQGGSLEQIGVTGVCHSKTSAAVYHAWYQVDPAHNHNIKLPSFVTIQAGDVIQVSVEDDALIGVLGVKPGNLYRYTFSDNSKDDGGWVADLATPKKAPGASAEYITEGVSGGPNWPHDAIGLAATQPVHWDHALIAVFNGGGAFPLDTTADWTARNLTMTKTLHGGAVYITTGPLGTDASGYSTFTNKFVWPN